MTGRSLPPTAFTGDDGSADERLAASLGRLADDPAAEGEVLAALAAARVLVPLTAVAGKAVGKAVGEKSDPSADMALVTLVGDDGRRALPAFTSVAAMAAWDPSARPVPVATPQAALAALDDGARLLVLDLAGPTPYVVPETLLRALAAGRLRLPAYQDPAVLAAVGSAAAGERHVSVALLLPAPGVDARVGLVLDPNAPAGDVPALARRVAERLQDSDAVRAAVVRGLDLALLAEAPAAAQVAYRRRTT